MVIKQRSLLTWTKKKYLGILYIKHNIKSEKNPKLNVCQWESDYVFAVLSHNKHRFSFPAQFAICVLDDEEQFLSRIIVDDNEYHGADIIFYF